MRPLVPRSAAEVPMLATQSDLGFECRELLRKEAAIIGALDSAWEAVRYATLRDRLAAFRRVHEGHYEAIAALISRLGGVPPHLPQPRDGIRLAAALAVDDGDPEAALRHVGRVLTPVTEHYERLAGGPPELVPIATTHLIHLSRLRAWIEHALNDRVWMPHDLGSRS